MFGKYVLIGLMIDIINLLKFTTVVDPKGPKTWSYSLEPYDQKSDKVDLIYVMIVIVLVTGSQQECHIPKKRV